MSSNGEPMGGFIGTLKTIKRIIAETGAKSVYMAWEGGGSARRRAIFAEYKLGRRPEKLNRFYEDDIPSTDDNERHQKLLLLKACKFLPFCQLYASDAEGDDLIAYLSENSLKHETQRIIVSSDKDFYQLLDDRTSVYNLHKKSIVTKQDVLEQFRISTRNFAVAKAICGDHGDNVPGIEKFGFKTLIKHVPMLGNDIDVSLDDVISFCRTHVNDREMSASARRWYQRIIDFEADARRNWRLVYLNGNMISPNQASKIDNAVKTFVPTIDKMSFNKLLLHEGLNEFNVTEFIYGLHGIDGLKYRT